MDKDTETKVALTLPGSHTLVPAKTASDGTVVYSAKDDSTSDVAVQGLPDGSVRLQTITRDKNDPRTFTYRFGDGITPVLTQDGSVSLQSGATGSKTIIGHIAQPWAKDAEGAPVATHYEVTGNDLRQVIEPTETTTYPIVADPKVSVGVGIYVYAFGSEYKYLSAAFLGGVGATAGALCGLQKLPGGWGAAIKAVCSTLGVQNAHKIVAFIKAVASNPAIKDGTCYEARWIGHWEGLKPVAASLCR